MFMTLWFFASDFTLLMEQYDEGTRSGARKCLFPARLLFIVPVTRLRTHDRLI